MAQPNSKQPAPSADYKTIAAEYARAKRAKEASDAAKQQQQQQQQEDGAPKTKANASELQRKAFEARRKSAFGRRWWWAVGFWLWLLSIHAVGILLFTSGFLLTRMVLDEKSACAVPPVEPAGRWKGMGTVEGGCWHPKSFDKAVVVIIDALRYDFTVPVADNAPFHNAFPFLHETALRAPQNAFLRPFIADPPTATLQRLKGLTTGTLPTFIDAGSNFAGTAIEEDNLLMQMKGLGQRIVHIGDDTWVSLFPDYFEPNISRAYDSFNVWDLHTVDTGVIDHLAPLLQPENKGKWDVLIGHLLGVDHAGHRYGPDHPAMKAKLEQMDAWLRDLSTQIDDDTVLIVMGDHGMDEKGDHGGESDDEVEAALWMYSKRPFFGRTDPNHVQPPATGKERPVNQIDLVPTLALLLGIPIPFNNLGGPIEEAFVGAKGNDWANLAAMITGIIVMAAGVIMLLVYASRDEDEDFAATDIELDFAEKKLELQGIVGAASPEYMQLHKNIVVAAVVGAIPGAFAGAAGSQLLGVNDLTYAAAAAAFASIVAALVALTDAGKGILNILPTSVWGWLSVLFTVSQSVGFASNSYTIWEDSILLFFISTFGAISAVASFSIPSPVERTLAVYHSVLFIVLGRVASFSKLCREEQMPYCTSTYYASSSSSTSAGWQLLIPFVVAFALPAIIKSFLVPSRSWEGLGPTWIGYIYRAGLFMAALYWVLDAADNGEWVPGLPEQTLKTIAVYVAQLVLALVFVAGTTAFVWAPPLVSVVQSRAPDGSNKVVILGYGNTNGARYLLLPMNLLAGCILLSKPMGGGALALVFWQTMSLMEILDLNGLTAESIGPVMLALLGNFAYFKTGHQATPSSIQWDSAFIPLFTIRYPWTPIVVALNHFGAQIIAANITFATMAANGNFTAQEQYKGNADQSKDEVGWYFVEQYYTTLSKTPEKLHLFYGKRSQFVYGKEAEVATVSVGRNAIQERIKELDFQDCKVRVTNVDSMASFDNIVIQVIGETSNKAAEPQKFVQTFVLAPQPSGYFVVNDILRFVNEEGEEEAVVETQEEQVNIEPSPPAAEAEKAPVEAEEETKEEAAIDADEVDKKLEDSVEETAASTDEAASNADEAKAEEPVEAVPEAAAETNPEAVAAEVAQDDVKEAEKPADPSPTPVAPPAKAEKPVAAVPAKHMSWASRAAAAVGPKAAVPLPKAAVPAAKSAAPASATPAATATAAASPQPSAAVQQPTESKEASQAATEWQSVSDSKRQNRPQSISGPPTENKDTLGYVKYVTDKVKTEDLRAALAAHGELTYFDVNRQKNCAFVEFATAAGYQAAAAANPHTVNGETIHVEARRPKAGAYGGSNYASGRGGAPSRGRGGFEGQRQGSQGGGRGNFTGGQGRGRGAPRGRGASQAATNA
ncbi:hypothetical protein BN1708_000808 [Verticillium longisporum]|uniref:Uncharacterized protein n=1 Tax=Verticillium longisporum TaxID=100787 RepID=A0A0G4M7M4_VERLO|nr:hypothetical protein BN1708_000808 [Verticillium longisporum]